jgi:hypothetical protein
MDSVQSAGLAPCEHCVIPQPRIAELMNRHDAVLAGRDLAYLQVRPGAFFTHMGNKAPGDHDSPPHDLLAGRPKVGQSAILRPSLAPWARGFLL